jgi:hypothetical protein
MIFGANQQAENDQEDAGKPCMYLHFFPPSVIEIVEQRGKRFPVLLENVKPSFMPEPEDHAGDNGSHHDEDEKIAVAPMQFRHVVKVHAVHSGNKGERNKNSLETIVSVIIMAFIRLELSVW